MPPHSIIAHIGLHKTGSTTLQRDFFSNLPEVKLVRGFDSIRKLMMPQPGDEAAVVLLSDESISATPAWVAPCGGIDSFAESLDTFHALFRPIGYVVAFRQHASWIRSMYCQYLHEGGTGLFSEFYRLEGGGLLELDLTPWRSRYIKLLTKVPAESVFVYLQEDLLASPRTVLASLRCFLLRSATETMVPASEQVARGSRSVAGTWGTTPAKPALISHSPGIDIMFRGTWVAIPPCGDSTRFSRP